MKILDAQIHCWGSGLPSNRSHRQVTRFAPEDALVLMDDAGVDAAIINPPGWDPGSHDMAATAVADYPGRFAIVGSILPDDPQGPERIAAWKSTPGQLGLRTFFLSTKARQTLQDGGADWIWAAAEAAEVPICMMATPCLDLVGRVAEQYPGLRLTIDHLGGLGGFEERKDHEAMGHIPGLLDLAKFPNVAVKVTGAPGYSSEAYPFPILAGYIRRIYDAFGPDRMFWGTDITKMPCSWSQCITMFTEEMPWLSDSDKILIMGEALSAWWGWDRSEI
jgi:predicted TIM-barrel fold metal-dependent hydrolase